MPIKENKNKSDAKEQKERTLRILLIEPRGQYCRTVWCAIGVGFAHILIGATVMTILMYFLSSNDTHALLYTVAYHFFSAEAILSLNFANGWSAPMRLRHRRFVHILLQACALICVIIGTVSVSISKGISGSIHGITGITTVILTCISFSLGPFALYRGRKLKLMHSTFGVPTFIMSSICLASGLFTSDFKNWANPTVRVILISFIIFYTIFVVVACFIKCMMRI